MKTLWACRLLFLDKFNPDQFEILGNEYDLKIDKGRGYVKGQRMYSRIFIRRKKADSGGRPGFADKGACPFDPTGGHPTGREAAETRPEVTIHQ